MTLGIADPTHEPTDAELFAVLLAHGLLPVDSARQAFVDIAKRHDGDLGFAKALRSALDEQAAGSKRALRTLAQANSLLRLHAHPCMDEVQSPARVHYDLNGKHVKEKSWPLFCAKAKLDELAAVLDFGAGMRSESVIPALARSGLAFSPGSLRRIAMRWDISEDSRWAFHRIREAELADGVEEGAAGREAGEFAMRFLASAYNRRSDGSALNFALELRRLGIATAAQMNELLASALSKPAIADCRALRAAGAALDSTLSSQSAVAQAIGRLMGPHLEDDTLPRTHAFIADLAELGILGELDAVLAPALSRGFDAWQDSPYTAASNLVIGKIPAHWRDDLRRTTKGESLALFAALARGGASIDAAGGLALFESLINADNGRTLDLARFELLLEAGADPKAGGTALLAAPLSWRIAKPAAAQKMWQAKMAALGIHAKGVPVRCPMRLNPVAWAMGQSLRGAYAAALLDAGAPLDWEDSETGETLVSILARHSREASLPLMDRLLAHPGAKALIDRIPSSGERTSALMRACFALDLPMAKALLDAGASVNLADPGGMAALHHLARKRGSSAPLLAKAAALAELLVSRGADPSLRDAQGRTAGQAMAAKGPLGALSLLIESRPEDLLGEDELARSTQAALAKRGAEATSAVEKAILRAEPAGAPAPKAKARRI